MSTRKLVAWIGNTDLRASRNELRGALGPIGQAVSDRRFDEIHLLSDHDKAATSLYASWLSNESGIATKVWPVKLSGPTRFDEIYESASKVLESLRPSGRKSQVLTFHLSPGTPAMAAVWILLAKTKFPAELIESSPEEGVRTVSLPFEIAVDYVPAISMEAGDELMRLTQGLPPAVPEFEAIIHRCQAVKTVIAQSRSVAADDVPVLIAEVARHYLDRAYDEADGNKSAACKLVGLQNYQTFTNWMKKYGVGR
jgi:hypothetical protein